MNTEMKNDIDLVVSTQNLSKSYGKLTVLDAVALEVYRGEILALLGVNGAGKTTLLKSFLGMSDFEGDVSVFGHSPKKEKQKILLNASVVADVAVLPRWARAQDLLDFCANMHPKFNLEKALRILSVGKIDLNSRISSFSKGMLAQLHLALAVSVDADLLVLDEPTLGLDILYRKAFYRQMIEDYYDQNKTIIMSTHQIEEVEDLITHVAIVHEGKIILKDSIENIQRRFTAVAVRSDAEQKALALKPISTQKVFGKSIMIFQDQDINDLLELGEKQKINLSDVFVSLVGSSYK